MEELIRVLKGQRIGILYLLKMVPPEIWDWKPEQSMRTTAELANHLACAPLMTYKGLIGHFPDEESYVGFEKDQMPENSQELVELYETGLITLTTFLEEHLEDAHVKKIQFWYQTEKSSIYEETFGEIGHELLHLGQLFVYLKQNGVPVDQGAYYGYRDPDETISPNK